YRSQNSKIAGTRYSVVLSHDVEIKREVFIEGVIAAHGSSITHPTAEAPIIEDFIRNVAGTLKVLNGEWMFNLAAYSIAPGVALRLAPAPLEPVAFDQSEFSDRKPE